jgi:hypothetical protein
MMKTLNTLVLAGSVLTLAASAAAAQMKTIPAETITKTVTIEAIEQSHRLLTVRSDDGTYDILQVPTAYKRFSELKVGDSITARYYSSLIVRIKEAGEKAVDTTNAAETPGTGKNPGGTIAMQRTVTVTVTAIDPKAPSITVKGPNGWTYTSRVNDTEALAKVKVGDRLDVTWNDAVLISVTPAK